MKFSIEVGAPTAHPDSLKNVAILHLKIDHLEITTFMRLAYRIFRGLAKGSGGGWLLLLEERKDDGACTVCRGSGRAPTHLPGV